MIIDARCPNCGASRYDVIEGEEIACFACKKDFKARAITLKDRIIGFVVSSKHLYEVMGINPDLAKERKMLESFLTDGKKDIKTLLPMSMVVANTVASTFENVNECPESLKTAIILLGVAAASLSPEYSGLVGDEDKAKIQEHKKIIDSLYSKHTKEDEQWAEMSGWTLS